MSSLKRFTVKQPFADYEVTLEANLDTLTIEKANMINNFWSDPEGRLDDEDGDVKRTVIRLFGRNAIHAMLAAGGATFNEKNKNAFSGQPIGHLWTTDLQEEEGWGGTESDGFGWCGIRIVAADVPGVDYESLELEEVAQ